jgi:hypothetical protein
MVAMFKRLGADQSTAEHLVDAEGIGEISAISLMTKSDVEQLCKSMRSPGGEQADGNRNRGHNLSNRFQTQLNQAVFYMKTMRRVSRDVTAGDIEVSTIDTRILNLKREKETDYTNPSQVDVQINKKDWAKTFIALEQALGTIKGIDGAPLSYCMRKDEAVTAEASDPTGNYSGPDAEMIARSPIVNAGPNATGLADTFTMDNPTVWDQVQFTFQNTEEWTHIRTFRKTQDGRGAIQKLRSVKMGTQYVQNQSGIIEKQFRELSWSGDKRNWNFENYATKHQHYFNLMKELEGYQEPNEGTRVRMLMDGIKTTILDSAKNTILSSDTLRTDFDGCVAQFTNFLGAMPSSVENRDQRRNASELNSDGGTTVQNRFYTAAEYKNLEPAQRTALYEMRKKDGKGKDSGKPKGKRSRNDKPFRDQNKVIKKQGEQISRMMSQLSTTDSDNDDAAPTTAEADTELASNRTNPALRRRRGSRAGRTTP